MRNVEWQFPQEIATLHSAGDANKRIENALQFQQAEPVSRRSARMSRNFYILAATLGFFALISGAMTLVPSSFQPGLPANGSLWRTMALLLLLAALASALIGVLSNLFEQVDRRSEEARRAARNQRRGNRKP
jgi:polyferredoxin